MKRVHLVYPHADRISYPDAIGRNLAAQLANRYEVRLYDWDSVDPIRPERGDILLGHPHPFPGTTFRRSMQAEGWGRRLILAPYNHGDARQSAWLESVVRRCDLYLAITGDHWFETAPDSVFAHWVPKMVQMDLAIDRRDFPVVKTSFNPPGARRYLFIGHSRWTKNVDYLSRIAEGLGANTISWMGLGPTIAGAVPLGLQDFSRAEALALVAEHDFLISVGRADANPAVVLEAMAWGLIPACSIQSAHADLPGIVDLPLDDVDGAVNVLRDLQTVDEEALHGMVADNWATLDSRFTWIAFGERVTAAIESSSSPRLSPTGSAQRRQLMAARLRSPYGWWRPMQLREVVGRWRRSR